MKERPILFSAPMVRALLAGTKTQTRRGVKGFLPCRPEFNEERGLWEIYNGDSVAATLRCPYGQPGDRLWVRENGWQRPFRSARDMREGADTWPPYEYDAEPVCCWEDGELKRLGWKRRPSIHMPRWASRILLEVTAVRVERLQDISATDAIAEGLSTRLREHDAVCHLLDQYRDLWESINGPESWDANPFVWVVEFKRVRP